MREVENEEFAFVLNCKNVQRPLPTIYRLVRLVTLDKLHLAKCVFYGVLLNLILNSRDQNMLINARTFLTTWKMHNAYHMYNSNTFVSD